MKTSITNKQIAFIIFGAIIGYGAMELPKKVVEAAGSGGWTVLIISTLVATIIVYILTSLGLRFENLTLPQYSEILTGKFFGKIISLIYIIHFFMVLTMISRVSAEIIRTTILIRTPVIAIMFFLYLITFYAVSRGVISVALMLEFYGSFIFIFALIIHGLIFSRGEIVNLRPFLGNRDLIEYINAIPSTIITFLGIEVLVVVPFQNLKRKKTYIYNLGITIIIGILYVFMVESCLSVLGRSTIIYHEDTILATIRRINIKSLQIFRRIDGFFLMAWIMAIFSTLFIYAYSTFFMITQYFSRKSQKLSFNLIAIVVSIISFIVAILPKTLKDAKLALTYTSYFLAITGITIPLILLILSKVKKSYNKSS